MKVLSPFSIAVSALLAVACSGSKDTSSSIQSAESAVAATATAPGTAQDADAAANDEPTARPMILLADVVRLDGDAVANVARLEDGRDLREHRLLPFFLPAPIAGKPGNPPSDAPPAPTGDPGAAPPAKTAGPAPDEQCFVVDVAALPALPPRPASPPPSNGVGDVPPAPPESGGDGAGPGEGAGQGGGMGPGEGPGRGAGAGTGPGSGPTPDGGGEHRPPPGLVIVQAALLSDADGETPPQLIVECVGGAPGPRLGPDSKALAMLHAEIAKHGAPPDTARVRLAVAEFPPMPVGPHGPGGGPGAPDGGVQPPAPPATAPTGSGEGPAAPPAAGGGPGRDAPPPPPMGRGVFVVVPVAATTGAPPVPAQ